MEYFYFLEVVADENRSNRELFSQIRELATPEERIFSDASTIERRGLSDLLRVLKKDDLLIVRSVLDISDALEELTALLSHLKKVGVELYSFEEPFLNSKCAFDVLTGVKGLLRVYTNRKKVLGYKRAVAEKRVGRPPKTKSIEKALALYNKRALTVGEIAAVTGVSRTTIYKYIKEKESGGKQ